MSQEDILLTAVIQAAVDVGAILVVRVGQAIVRVEHAAEDIPWFGRICFHRNEDDSDKDFIILYQSPPMYPDAETAQVGTEKLLAELLRKKYSGITADTFFRPAQIQAASIVRGYQAVLTLVIDKGVDLDTANDIVKRNLDRYNAGSALTVDDLIRGA